MGLMPASAAGQTDSHVGADQVVVEPVDGAVLRVGERFYAGRLVLTGHEDGISLVEHVSLDQYLQGIREVPFSWHAEALRAQAVAARTYLAWTLERGRSSNGRRYGYDICATDACQVYAGIGGVGGPDGDRWKAAVEDTSDEILTLGGRAIQALYSSTSGGRTRAVEDVFPRSDPIAYLQAVDSPGETSPFTSWTFDVPAEQMASMLAHAELLDGDLVGVHTEVTPDGDGPWVVIVTGTEGVRRLDTWTLRTRLNRAAADLYPHEYPVLRPDASGRRYPQTIMSPTFTIARWLRFEAPGEGPPFFRPMYHVRGFGWGHLVGMSQYGAEAMAGRGSDHVEILAHYYGGLRPEKSSLPDQVAVGLSVEAAEISIVPEGPVRVTIDGQEVTSASLGSWRFAADGSIMIVEPPVGLGLPPRVDRWQVFFDDAGPELVSFRSLTAAELRVSANVGGRRVFDSGWQVRDAGIVAYEWRVLTGRARPDVPLVIVVEARSPQGSDRSVFQVLPGAE